MRSSLLMNLNILQKAILGAIAIFITMINVGGGFLVTKRMLQMFRK